MRFTLYATGKTTGRMSMMPMTCVGGANGNLGLDARKNLASFGVCDERFVERVRVPLAEEH
jgi:hypothetical protein